MTILPLSDRGSLSLSSLLRTVLISYGLCETRQQASTNYIVRLDSTPHNLYPDLRILLDKFIVRPITLRGGVRIEFHICVDELVLSAPTHEGERDMIKTEKKRWYSDIYDQLLQDLSRINQQPRKSVVPMLTIIMMEEMG